MVRDPVLAYAISSVQFRFSFGSIHATVARNERKIDHSRKYRAKKNHLCQLFKLGASVQKREYCAKTMRRDVSYAKMFISDCKLHNSLKRPSYSVVIAPSNFYLCGKVETPLQPATGEQVIRAIDQFTRLKLEKSGYYCF